MLRVVRLVTQLGDLIRLGDLQALQLTPHNPHITQEHFHGVAGSHAVLDDRGEVLVPVIQAILVVIVDLAIVGVSARRKAEPRTPTSLVLRNGL